MNESIEQEMLQAQRHMAAFTYHSVLLGTYGEGGVAWSEELGEMIDALSRAANVFQGVFDLVTQINEKSS